MTNSGFKERARTMPRLQAHTNSNIKPNWPLNKEKEAAHGTSNG